jgi:hypothetical protein
MPPHPTVRCDDRTAIWQIWVPAAELTLLTHYAATSLPSRVLSVLEMILQQLRGRTSRQELGGFGLPVTKNQVRKLNVLLPVFLLICGLGGSHVCRAAACCYGKMAGVGDLGQAVLSDKTPSGRPVTANDHLHQGRFEDYVDLVIL